MNLTIRNEAFSNRPFYSFSYCDQDNYTFDFYVEDCKSKMNT